ncbi:N-acetylneuraminate synthase family protein [Bradyrhizobium sp. AUGA SZCCT0158]|uniref:N-acetylneuraminate synthase family protein n=1 Tax=Bradyrhizobium sp. AUGA SZCCT0158 TaxID=2807661 RepID=UPI0020111B2A|nr:N-acetylneuraminate synthase family protein [Bradyrhizobium sp. AUGA SZCCT0158]
MTRRFSIGRHPLAPDAPPLFFAEIGSYFNGDVDLAAGMIKRILAAQLQVPEQPLALKTEILNDPEICLPGDTTETYAAKDGRTRQENYRTLIERKVVPLEAYARLFKLATDANVPLVVSIYDFVATDFAAAHGAAALKIPSSNLVHIPLIRHAAAKGLPLVIDTGRSTIGEVHRAVSTARAAGCEDIVIQHSPDGHPALPKAHNLRILQTYLSTFGVPVGLSDHHVGLEALYLSIALGATVLEKGVHVAADELDQDISHSAALDDLPRILRSVYESWQAMGKPARDPKAKIDGVIGTSQRQCVVAKHDLKPGSVVSFDTVRFAFPCKGIPVEYWDLVAGWTITSPVAAGTPVQWHNVQQRPS